DSFARLDKRVHLAADVHLIVAGVGARVRSHHEAAAGQDTQTKRHGSSPFLAWERWAAPLIVPHTTDRRQHALRDGRAFGTHKAGLCRRHNRQLEENSEEALPRRALPETVQELLQVAPDLPNENSSEAAANGSQA